MATLEIENRALWIYTMVIWEKTTQIIKCIWTVKILEAKNVRHGDTIVQNTIVAQQACAFLKYMSRKTWRIAKYFTISTIIGNNIITTRTPEAQIKKSANKLKKILRKVIEMFNRQESMLNNRRSHETNSFSFAYEYISIYKKRKKVSLTIKVTTLWEHPRKQNLKLFKFRLEIKWKFFRVSAARCWNNWPATAKNI